MTFSSNGKTPELNKDIRTDTHIFPFLWMHGESCEQIEREILAIRDCGIRMFCAESRPHPDFCGDGWWKDFGFVLKTAKKLGMRVWLLDDKHYPTGYANGAVEKYPQYKQKFVKAVPTDFIGNGQPCRFVLSANPDDEPVAAFVYKRSDKINGVNLKSGKELDISALLKNGVLTLPASFYGHLRVVVLYRSSRYIETGNYIDMLNPESAALQIKEVYEPHYEHFAEYFGNTFIGFFSDEPRFGNGKYDVRHNGDIYNTKIGEYGIAYPWSDDMFALLGGERKEIAALWFNTGKDHAAEYRIKYMNIITDAYRRNFSEAIGAWCESHGVLYTGHITEDMNDHCRLGSGAGHYFRSMTGQHLAGIDVVLHQIHAGFADYGNYYPCFSSVFMPDPDFFHFTLPKLGVSAAHLESKKKNRTMCEIFGAYGWGESINLMKWLVDFMLVRGVNYFVPHAFNPRTDDTDCPPYFYHGGKNPTFSAFKELMKYTEKTCAELSEDYSVEVAVLYHAEADWSGREYTPMDKVCRLLTENQIDFEIVPSEYLDVTKASVLIVPYAEYRGSETERKISEFNGEVIRANKSNGGLLAQVKALLPTKDVGYALLKKDKYIRVLKRGNKYFVFNEGIKEANNTLLTGDGKAYRFRLAAGESFLFKPDKLQPRFEKRSTKLSTECKIDVLRSDEENYVSLGAGDYTEDINDRKGYEDFTGKVRYKTSFVLREEENYWLDFGELVGGLKVWVNGKEKDELFGAPYLLDVSDSVRAGDNELIFELSTTLALKYKDALSSYVKVDKCGLTGAIKILKRIK